jgi:hypothetical protein
VVALKELVSSLDNMINSLTKRLMLLLSCVLEGLANFIPKADKGAMAISIAILNIKLKNIQLIVFSKLFNRK